MATNRKRRTIVEETLDDKEGTESAGANVTDFIITASKVYRLNGGTKSFVTQTTEIVDEVFLQSNYPAGGKYVVYEYNTMNQLLNTTNYDIEPKQIASNGNGSSANASIQDIQVRMLFDELAHSRQMVLTLISNMANNNRGGSLTELVTALASMHQLTGGSSAGKDPVELLIKGMEIGQNGGKVSTDWKEQLFGTLKEVAPGVVQAIAASKNPAALPPAPGEQPMLPMTPEALLKEQIQQIKSYAIGGLNVDLAVEWITNNARDVNYQPLLRLAIHGDVNSFISLDPEVANEPYRTWFTTAIQQIKEWYAEQQVPTEDNMDGGVGDGTNTRNDARVSNRSANVAKIV